MVVTTFSSNFNLNFKLLWVPFQPYKKWVCDDEPLKTVLMLRFITSGAKICQYVYCCLRWFWHGSHQSLLWTKRWASSTYLLHSTFPHSMHKKRFEQQALKAEAKARRRWLLRKENHGGWRTKRLWHGTGPVNFPRSIFKPIWSKEKVYVQYFEVLLAKRTGNWGHQNCCAFSTFN